MSDTIGAMRHHQLTILKQLLRSPLTEFELCSAVAHSTGFGTDIASELMPQWLDELKSEGLIWAGLLFNAENKAISAAALTTRGRNLVM